MLRVVGWRGILVLAAVCSLTLTVATRYCVTAGAPADSGHVVKTRLAEPKVQHLVLDQDSVQGLPPVGRLTLGLVATNQARIAADGTPVPIVDFHDPISSRAPPLSTPLV